jgi:hypothetical protein
MNVLGISCLCLISCVLVNPSGPVYSANNDQQLATSVPFLSYEDVSIRDRVTPLSDGSA